MLTSEIRKKFLQFFSEKGHTPLSSSPTVPHDDPTLLFTNAGMNQFKDVFLGHAKRDYVRATTSQKCIRVGGKHNDLDNVGHTARHMTFFEMLGNFSFGDYFKKEAIAYAFEVTTDTFKFPVEKLWVSVFEEDNEAFELWKAHLPEKRIVRMGASENFWSMGDTGPCGPCSELLFDRGEKYGSAINPLAPGGDERYPEFWNLVFMQYNQDASGRKPLAAQSVDTGAGLERVAMFGQGLESVFETDILRTIIVHVEKISKKTYGGELAPAFHVVADHLRALCFAIADGAQPSNVERGYVLRKILRRAVRYGRLLDLNQPFLSELVPTLVDQMGQAYPELIDAKARTEEILHLEEESFLRTLQRGGNILSSIIEKAESGNKHISGADAFKLKDTYGFPIEEILLLAKDHDLDVNLDAFEMLETQAREKSKKAHKKVSQQAEKSAYVDFVKKHGPCAFVGFETCQADSTIIGIVQNGAFVEQMHAGEEGIVILDSTPFYPEKGGQTGDVGQLIHKSNLFEVTDTQEPYPGVIAHHGKLTDGTLIVSEPLSAHVNETRRKEITCYHSATHLLQWALIEVLGPHIRQAGSLVTPCRLRFDFNHHKPLTSAEIRQIETLINERIRENAPLKSYELTFDEVQKRPDIKQFFGDKYGSTVRVVDIGGFSKELCGGTHVEALHDIGLFRIAKESSIAAGVRRIEAVVGAEAEKLMYANDDLLALTASHLQTTPLKLAEKIENSLNEMTKLKAELKIYKAQALHKMAQDLTTNIETINSIPAVIAQIDVQPAELAELSTQVMDRLKSGVICFALRHAGKGQLLVRVSADYVAKGVKAGALIKELAPIIGGGGGGKPDSAQAGGKDPDKIPDALDHLRKILTC